MAEKDIEILTLELEVVIAKTKLVEAELATLAQGEKRK